MPQPEHASPRAVAPSVNGWNAEYLDAEYARYRSDPASVSADLRAFFQGFDLASDGRLGLGGGSPVQRRADALVHAYRSDAHLAAKTDPFGRPAKRPETIAPAFHGLKESDLEAAVEFPAELGPSNGTLRQLIAALERVYVGSIGFEFMHIPDAAQREWFRTRIEAGKVIPKYTPEQRTLLLEQLTSAEVYDEFANKRYPGKKRFSLEGGEGLIPLLKWMTERAGQLGVEDIVAGMPHRGRVSVLLNWVGKDPRRVLTEFEDKWVDPIHPDGGDVKYHRGYSGDQTLANGKSVHISMLNNPSHLESVNGVAMGKCRAAQDLRGDTERRKVLSVSIHGDGAVIGQGVVAECLNMSQLEGYTVGGTIRVVVNNLVAFTTDPEDDRSTAYCTDIGKMIHAPVLHVNGDDPEAIAAAAMLAVDYRHEFRRDIFIDLVCYRLYGHNESDEPRYTQPELYRAVDARGLPTPKHRGPAFAYRATLTAEGVISEGDAEAMYKRAWARLDEAQTAAKAQAMDPVQPAAKGEWAGLAGKYTLESPKTAVDAKTIAEVCAAMGRVPESFQPHNKLRGLLQSRASLPQTKRLSHADAEQIAVGTLLLEGVAVRISGQDSRRGTFTSRHGVLRDERTGEKYTPLNHVRPGKQATCNVWDSPLSEYSVMGFDYGYARGNPKALVMWEGQFGDFCNTAQVIIDQYMAASEVKWNRWSGLVLLLPHGYEGQGPEHSSGRMERFLLLCANDNMEVVYPSTAAQTFHLLRRQALRNFRKPLIVMTPKKYLRFESSSIDELSTGEFKHLIDDAAFAAPNAAKMVSRVVYCTGKVFHELDERRQKSGRNDVAIVRVEQLYPFHSDLASRIDARYPERAERVWVQEEPRNAGAFLYAADTFREKLGIELRYIGRPASATPATGFEHTHKEQQEHVLSEAIGPLKGAGATTGQASAHGASPPPTPREVVPPKPQGKAGKR